MAVIAVTQHEEVLMVSGVEFTSIHEGNLYLLDFENDLLAVFASGTWMSAVKIGEDDD